LPTSFSFPEFLVLLETERILNECHNSKDAYHHEYSYCRVENVARALLPLVGTLGVPDEHPNAPDKVKDGDGEENLDRRINDNGYDFGDERHSF